MPIAINKLRSVYSSLNSSEKMKVGNTLQKPPVFENVSPICHDQPKFIARVASQ